jgi:hypothetical protein
MTQEFAQNPESQLRVIDSGFKGTVGMLLGKIVANLYNGDAAMQSDRLAIKLVHASPKGQKGHGTFINKQIEPYDPNTVLPKTTAWIGAKNLKEITSETSTAALAISLQLQPRYHGPYIGLYRTSEGRVGALSRKEKVATNIEKKRRSYDINGSIVNPLAAAIVQRHVVSAALQRRQTSDSQNW